MELKKIMMWTVVLIFCAAVAAASVSAVCVFVDTQNLCFRMPMYP